MIVLSLIIGAIIAVGTRLSFLVFTTDLDYIKIGSWQRPDHRENKRNIGKEVIGEAGFPFRAFSNCVVKGSGSDSSRSACKEVSTLGELSILLNWGVWSVLVYFILNLFSSLIAKPGK